MPYLQHFIYIYIFEKVTDQIQSKLDLYANKSINALDINLDKNSQALKFQNFISETLVQACLHSVILLFLFLFFVCVWQKNVLLDCCFRYQ